jgi:hypothetical protein
MQLRAGFRLRDALSPSPLVGGDEEMEHGDRGWRCRANPDATNSISRMWLSSDATVRGFALLI